jgi:hypothetical protein
VPNIRFLNAEVRKVERRGTRSFLFSVASEQPINFTITSPVKPEKTIYAMAAKDLFHQAVKKALPEKWV